MTRPWRSALYIPANKDRAMDKVRHLPCDAILFDLEDAVAPGSKAEARLMLAGALAANGFGNRARIVRINGLNTLWGADDVQAVAGLDCDGILLPKVNTPADVEALAALIPHLPIWAMLETPLGVLNAAAIAGHPRMAGMVIGTNDLAKDLRTRDMPHRGALFHALQTCVIAARAHGLVALDGVFNAFRDPVGLAAECEQGRDMGFDGKSLIHPDQIAIANAAFAPTPAEITLARRQIAAFEQADAEGLGIAVLDDRIVESLHILTARATLAKAEAIAGMETT